MFFFFTANHSTLSVLLVHYTFSPSPRPLGFAMEWQVPCAHESVLTALHSPRYSCERKQMAEEQENEDGSCSHFWLAATAAHVATTPTLPTTDFHNTQDEKQLTIQGCDEFLISAQALSAGFYHRAIMQEEKY